MTADLTATPHAMGSITPRGTGGNTVGPEHVTTSYYAQWAASAAAAEISAISAVAAATRALANTPPPQRVRASAASSLMPCAAATEHIAVSAETSTPVGSPRPFASFGEVSSGEHQAGILPTHSSLAAHVSQQYCMRAAMRIEALVRDMQADRLVHEQEPLAMSVTSASISGMAGSFGGASARSQLSAGAGWP